MYCSKPSAGPDHALEGIMAFGKTQALLIEHPAV
jgi:hypothetical protein